MNAIIVQVISLIGAGLILLAFTLAQRGRWQVQQGRYLWANTLGSGLLFGIAWLEWQWGFMLLEAVWFAVSVTGLWRLWRSPV